MITEINQTEKEILYDLTYMWNLKGKKNQICRKKKIRFVGSTGGEQGLDEMEKGGQKCKLPVISTGDVMCTMVTVIYMKGVMSKS